MAKAVKLPSGNWNVRALEYTDKNGKKHFKSFTAPTKKEAEYLAADYYANKRSKDRTGTNITLREAFRRYIDNAVLSPSTLRQYNQIARLRLQSVMDTNIGNLTNEDLQIALNADIKHLQPKTARNISGLLSAVLKEYRPDFQLHLKLPQKVKTQIYIPSEEQVKQLLKAAENTDMEIPLLLASCLGLRMSEVLGLKWSNVNFKSNKITIRSAIVTGEENKAYEKVPKTYAGYRTISAPSNLMEVLKKSRGEAEEDDHIVKLDFRQINYRFLRLLDKMQIPHFRFHDLRHYHASVLLAMGVPNKYAQERLGHATDNMLKTVYQHTMQNKRQELDNKLDDYFGDFFKS